MEAGSRKGSNKNNNGSPAEGLKKPKRLNKTTLQAKTQKRIDDARKRITEEIQADLTAKLALPKEQLMSWVYSLRQKNRRQYSSTVVKIGSVDSCLGKLKGAELNRNDGSGSGLGKFNDHGEMSLRREPGSVVGQIEAQLGCSVREDGPVLGIEFDEKPPVTGDSLHLVLGKGKKTLSDSMKATLAKMRKVEDSGEKSRDGGKKPEETSLPGQNTATSAAEQIKSSVRAPEVTALDKEPIPAVHKSCHSSPSCRITSRKRGRSEIKGTGQSLPVTDPKKQKVVDLQGPEPGQDCCVSIDPDEKWNGGTKGPTHTPEIFALLQDAEHCVDIPLKERAEWMRKRAGQFMTDAMAIAAEYEAAADAEEFKRLHSEVESLKKKNKDLGDCLTKSSSKIEDLVAQKTNMEKERTSLDGKLKAWKERAEKLEKFNVLLFPQVKQLTKKLENNASDHQSELESLRSAHRSEVKKLSAQLESTHDELERTKKEAGQTMKQAEKAKTFSDLLFPQVKELKKKLENNASDHQSELERLQASHRSEIKKLSAELESTRDELERTKEEAGRTFLVGYSICLDKFVAAGADPSHKQFEDYQAELIEELRLQEEKARKGDKDPSMQVKLSICQ